MPIVNTQKAPRQIGFSLLEVLVSLVVLSFGVLSALGLQAVSKRSTQNASQRTQAVHLAEDFFERLRNNFTLGGLDVYNGYTLDHEMGDGSFGSKPSPDCSTSNPCGPSQLAIYDLWEWERLLDGHTQTIPDTQQGQTLAVGGLVSPSACLYGPASGQDGEYTLVIVWRSSTPGVNPELTQAQSAQYDNINSCGNGTDEYGSDNRYRQIAALTTYIAR